MPNAFNGQPGIDPEVAVTAESFCSELRDHLKRRLESLEDLAIEMLARGLSVRDIEDAFKDEEGRLPLARTAVSEIGVRYKRTAARPG